MSDLERRSFNSYQARVETERRLRRVGLTWSAAQTALAVGLIAVSVLYLAYPTQQSTFMLVYLISLAVLALAVSVTVGALDYAGRAREMFRNYRAIQALSVRVESSIKSRRFISKRFLNQAQAEYDLLLDNVENHSQLDWHVVEAKARAKESRESWASEASKKAEKSTGALESPAAQSGQNKEEETQAPPRGLWFWRAIPYVLPSLLMMIAGFTVFSAVFTVIT